MAKKVFHSNHIEKLLEKLIAEINGQQTNIFTKDWIIAPTSGMGQWISIETAAKKNNGVFANFAIVNQDKFLRDLYKFICGHETERDQETAKWIIYKFLGSSDFLNEPEFNKVTEYYSDDNLRRVQLAERVANLFDQYQIYRAGMIAEWNDNRLVYSDSETEKWQKWLWQKLDIDHHIRARYKIRLDLLDAFKNEENRHRIKLKYPVINLFGNSIYTPFHIEIFDKLSEITDVSHFIIYPSEDITKTNEARNSLLKSWGKKYSELASIMNTDCIESVCADPGDKCLLNKVQHLVLRNTESSEAVAATSEFLDSDESIQINSAYTEVREVEILFNYLTDLKNRHKDLYPRDILVLTTNIDLYAPYIKAVFNNAGFKIPYKILGVSASQKESVITAFTSILDFGENDFTSEKVLSLLETKHISARYEITDLEKIRALVDKANIRFGIDKPETDEQGKDYDETRWVSWDFGLKKLTLGYAMLTENLYDMPGEESGLYPFNDIEEESGQEIFRLTTFINDLKNVVRAKKETRTLKEWKDFVIADVLEKMIQAANADKPDLAIIYYRLNSQEEAEKLKDENDEPLRVEFTVFWQGIKRSLMSEPGEFGFNSGKVTFSSYRAARGLPAKVIAFLGLNSSVFPPRDSPYGFDLISKYPETGDHNKKENDKMLFLETLMSARSHLYLSFIGKDRKDNTNIPPSIVADQLMDFLEGMVENPTFIREKLLQEHPLHGFSGKYRKDDRRFFSYLYGEKAGMAFQDKTEADSMTELREISLFQLRKFLEDPIKWYYEKVMGIKFEEIEGPLSETEMLEPDHLQKWEIRKVFMETRLEEKTLIKKLKMDGKLQLGAAGIRQFEEIKTEIQDVKDRYYQRISGDPDMKLVSIPLEFEYEGKADFKVTVSGTVEKIYNAKEIITYCVSRKFEHRDKVRAIMNHLALCASGEKIRSVCVRRDNPEEFFLDTIARKDASDKIEQIVKLYLEARDRMVLFAEEASKKIFELIEEENKSNSDEAKIEKLKKEALYEIKKLAYPEKYSFANLYIRQAWDEGLFAENFQKWVEDTIKINAIISF